MAYNKKPTMMEMKNAVVNLINSMDELYKYVSSLDITLTHYIDFKKDKKKFDSFIKKLVEKKEEETLDDKSKSKNSKK